MQASSIVAKLTVREGRRSDVDAYIDIQRESWGTMAATSEQVSSRFDIFLDGILVAEIGGQVVGAMTLIRLADYSADRPLSWGEATGHGWCTTHVPDGPIVFGVDLSSRGTVMAVPVLIEAAVAFVSTVGAVNLTWGGRMPGFAKYRRAHPDVTAEEYLRLRTKVGRYLDWQVRMYSEVVPGVEVVRVIPNYFDDPESENHGVMFRVPNSASR